MPLCPGRPIAALRRHPLWVGGGLILFLACLGFGVRTGIRDYQVRTARAAAEAALAHCDFDRAREHLAQCLRWRPGDASLHLLAAQTARRAGLLEEANEHLDACKAIRGRTEADERLERVLLTAQGGGLTEVEDYLFSRLAAKDPAGNRILEALAFGNIQVYRLEQGADCLQQLLEQEPENVTALHMLGIVNELMLHMDEALRHYRRALEIQPGNYRIRIQLARALWRQGQVEEAANQYEQVLSGHREKAVLLGLARCRIWQGQEDQARQFLDELLAEHPQDVEALLERGKLDRETGHLVEAESGLRKAFDLKPNNREVTFQLSQCLLAQGRHKEADPYLRQLEQIHTDAKRLEALRKQSLEVPSDPAPRYEAGVLALKRGDEEEGLRWLYGVLKLDPSHRPTHAVLADFYACRGQVDRAAFHRSQAIGALKH